MTISERVESLLGQMTLEEKAAQMVQVPYNAVSREEALRAHLRAKLPAYLQTAWSAADAIASLMR